MGYTTEFFGSFKLNTPLRPYQRLYLLKFSETRRMKRKICDTLNNDPLRRLCDLPLGIDGEFYVNSDEEDHTIENYNTHPKTQPGLWCKWMPNEAGTEILWNGVEKFYNYIEWLDYIIKNFIIRWGYVLNGSVQWEGERKTDVGTIKVVNNVIGGKEEIDVLNKMKWINNGDL